MINNFNVKLLWGLPILLVLAVLAWVMNGPSPRILTVAGNSMAPTLLPGAKVQLQTTAPEGLKHGDLVAIKFKTSQRPMLKRVIAIAGDQVEFVEGRLRLNGQWLGTAWWPIDKRLAQRNYKILAIQLSRYENRVPKNNLIVMGDNSNNSFDSGDYGMISSEQIIGRVNKK